MSEAQHRLYFLINTVAHRLRTRADEALLKSAGLTVSQVTALRVIVDEKAISPGAVARALGYRKSAMTGMINRLLDAHFITKSASPTDARAVILEPTLNGVRAITKLVDGFSEIDAHVSSALTPVQIEQVTHGLLTMLSAIERKAEAL